MSQYRDAILATPGLAGYWPIAGSRADASGYGQDATNFGAGPVTLLGPSILAPSVDPAGSSAEFDGSGANYLTIAHTARFNLASPGFACEAWGSLRSENPAASLYRGLMTSTNTSILRLGPSAPSKPRFQAFYYNNVPTAQGIASADNTPFPTPDLLTPYHLVQSVIDNGDGTFTQRLIVNGVLVLASPKGGVSASWSAAANPLLLGQYSGAQGWDGWGQHFAWYSQPLDVARFGHHYRLGAGLERRGIAERRFTFKAGTPASIDGSVRLPFGGALDLSDAYAAGGVVTADSEVAEGLRALGIFDEVAA